MSMAVSKRIRFFRKLRGMTQKRLGVAVGFPEKTADTRVAQYETDARGPKAALRERFAAALGVSVDALSIPDMDTPAGLMHTLFASEEHFRVSGNCGLRCERGTRSTWRWRWEYSQKKNTISGATTILAPSMKMTR